jgi:hypothetical protein
MSRNNKKRNRNNEKKIQKKVIRCTVLSRPVFEHEVCPQFISKVNSNNQKNCENCKHGF